MMVYAPSGFYYLKMLQYLYSKNFEYILKNILVYFLFDIDGKIHVYICILHFVKLYSYC